MNTYYESAEGEVITRERAIREVIRHSGTTETYAQQSVQDFLFECGDHATYDAQAVLRWLGY